MTKPAKNTICLWYNGDAEDAARFYAKTFPDSSVDAVHTAPGDFPSGKKGDVLTVEFTVLGIPCLGLNGGPAFKHDEAFSFEVATDDQAETDRYWNAIVGNGGQESACGWCKDKWGLSWQITPVALTKAITDPAVAKRAFDGLLRWHHPGFADLLAAHRERRGDSRDRRQGVKGGGGLGSAACSEPSKTKAPSLESWQARLARLTDKDSTLCPECGRGHLRRVQSVRHPAQPTIFRAGGRQLL